AGPGTAGRRVELVVQPVELLPGVRRRLVAARLVPAPVALVVPVLRLRLPVSAAPVVPAARLLVPARLLVSARLRVAAPVVVAAPGRWLLPVPAAGLLVPVRLLVSAWLRVAGPVVVAAPV